MSRMKWILGLATVVLAVVLAMSVATGTNAGKADAGVARDGGLVDPEEPFQKPQANGQKNLPVTQSTSKPVKQDDLEFQIFAAPIWPMPAKTGKSAPASQLPTGESPVRFQLRVTNHQKKAVRFLAVVGTPILQSADGKEFKVHLLGSNHLRTPKYLALAAGKTITIGGSAGVYTDSRQGTSLSWEDEFGTNYRIDGLKAGDYVLRLHYDARRHAEENTSVLKSGAWLGEVRTAEVPIKIVEWKESQTAVCSGVEALSRPDGTWRFKKATELGWKDDIEVTALAEAIWRVPAAGKQTQVCLGFRMATVEKWWVRIIPSLATVSVQSADGVELPVKKTAAKVSTEAPPLLGLRPEYSKTVTTPATLFHDGKTLTLAWADHTGQVWHVEHLKPGRYTVRYLIRAEKGEPSQYISYWVGEFRPPAVVIEIKE